MYLYNDLYKNPIFFLFHSKCVILFYSYRSFSKCVLIWWSTCGSRSANLHNIYEIWLLGNMWIAWSTIFSNFLLFFYVLKVFTFSEVSQMPPRWSSIGRSTSSARKWRFQENAGTFKAFIKIRRQSCVLQGLSQLSEIHKAAYVSTQKPQF